MFIQLKLEFLKAPFVTFCSTHPSDDIIFDIANYADDTTLYSKFDQASDRYQQLELASELESDLQWTGELCGLLISMLERLDWFRLTGLITPVLLT